jgi:hypothetical protein
MLFCPICSTRRFLSLFINKFWQTKPFPCWCFLPQIHKNPHEKLTSEGIFYSSLNPGLIFLYLLIYLLNYSWKCPIFELETFEVTLAFLTVLILLSVRCQLLMQYRGSVRTTYESLHTTDVCIYATCRWVYSHKRWVYSNPQMGFSTPQMVLFILQMGLFTSHMGLFTPQMGLHTPQTGLILPQMGLFTSQMGLFTPHRWVYLHHIWVYSHTTDKSVHTTDLALV